MTDIEKTRLKQQLMDCALVKAFEESILHELEKGNVDQVLEWLRISVGGYDRSIQELAQQLDIPNEVAQKLGYGLCSSKPEEM